jgi:AcrR family transcriptional regulator
MTITPWGPSELLRDRRLRPGPGTARKDVVANQRERLFGAMVASVAERGYEATRVSDLVAISGVSSRTFYDMFPDKQVCFLATLEALIQAAVSYTAQTAGEGEGERASAGVVLPEEPDDAGAASWEERSRRGFRAFAEMVASQPAAARLGLIEAYAAGPEAMAPLEKAVAGFEWLTRRMLEQSPERAEMPPEMVSAMIGAQQEIARTRLLQGREGELPGLSDELWELLMSYRPPPRQLRLSGRPPKPRPEGIDGHDHAERALGAFAAVVAEQGYADTTIDAVLKRAQMSATTFYAHFRGKEDAMLAAIDSAGAQLVAAILPPYRRASDWPEGIRAGFGALCSFLTSRPALARLLMVEVYAAGPAAVERRAETLRPLAALASEGYRRASGTPPIVAEAIAGVVFTLAYGRIRDSGPESLPSLAPLCTYIALSPFIGAEEACRVANGEDREAGNGAGPRAPRRQSARADGFRGSSRSGR